MKLFKLMKMITQLWEKSLSARDVIIKQKKKEWINVEAVETKEKEKLLF